MSHMSSAMDMDKDKGNKDTLTGESAYFSALFSGRWNGPDHDGSYFIDSNPELFVEVLRYLRSGNFPLYFDAKTSTFNYAKYTALLGEAQYFQIAKLEDWIVEKRFLKAVTISHHVEQIEDPVLDVEKYRQYCAGGVPPHTFFSMYKWGTKMEIPEGFQPPIALPDHLKNHSADTHLIISIVPKATKKMWLCRENNPKHYGTSCSCGGNRQQSYEDEHSVSIVVHKTQRIFHPEWCLGLTYLNEKGQMPARLRS
ncbi:hypothetical protein GGR57DRAFT_505626 [Xylariaceae sp. FL1272]|nr:hypothetical protein GGR57DRAFT_505626 [Xylariaceae sp. FL1272]